MFERYTETARRVIFSARVFASEAGSTLIEPEHILLAILREEPDVFRPWLKSESEYEALRAEIEGREHRQDRIPDSVNIPLSGPSKRVLAYAAEEAEQLHHIQIRPSHLLAGLLREPNTAAARALAGVGVEIQQIRMVFVASLKHSHRHRPETDDLHRLVDQLPSAQLRHARALLEALCQTRPEQA
jgi:ATP-dependent Clp protease ATP-binding subunit ClpC